jgi:hypothetical protein
MAQDRIHVVPQDGQWRVVTVGELFNGPYPTKDEAIEVAHLLALLHDSSQVLVHDESGNLESEIVYGPASTVAGPDPEAILD